MMAPVMAGAMTPVAAPTVLVMSLREPARLGAISCSESENPLLTAPKDPTARHMTVTASTSLHLTHVIAIRAAAETYFPGDEEKYILRPGGRALLAR